MTRTTRGTWHARASAFFERWPLLPLLYFGGLLVWGIVDFVAGEPLDVLYQVLTLAYLMALGAMYLLPGRPPARRRGDWWGQALALASANLLIPLAFLPGRALIPYPLTLVLLFAANALSWWGLLTLRSSFSLGPEARRLVTGGPYRLVRHPLYLAGGVIALALLLSGWSLPALGVTALYTLATVLRARAEERTLLAAFPAEYAAYRRRTAAVVPGVW
jgi:protein-S-isoprenylcysteine O-methyltransferase Ste14